MNTTPLDSIVANTLVPAYEDFGFQLLAWLVRQDADTNIVISPISVAIALAMADNGARGTTEHAIAQVLGLEGLNLQELNAANQLLLSMGDKLDAQIQLAFANSLWVKQGISLDDAFVQRLQGAYASEVANLDFANPDAAATINRWVAGKTQEKIRELVAPDLIQSAILVLINAIYFKGIWTQQFDKEKTEERTFTLPNGSLKPHPMMRQSGEYLYYENETFQAVSLPYGDGRVAMYIFLPQPSSSITAFQILLTAENYRNWLSQFYEMEGELVLPRFKVEYGKALNDTLTDLGMGEAFSEKANFEGMGAGNLVISQVIHKAFIEVNEEGTEAAAATAVIMARGIGAMSKFRMTVDRPFFYAIRDEQTGTLLFMGFVLDPASDLTTSDGVRNDGKLN